MGMYIKAFCNTIFLTSIALVLHLVLHFSYIRSKIANAYVKVT